MYILWYRVVANYPAPPHYKNKNGYFGKVERPMQVYLDAQDKTEEQTFPPAVPSQLLGRRADTSGTVGCIQTIMSNSD